MADAQRVIELIFKGIDETAAATRTALDNTRQFSESVRDATQPIADFTVGAVKFEAALLGAGVAMTAFSVAKASEFEAAMLDLRKVLDESDGPIERFTDAAREMAAQYGIAATDVLAATANFKQAGFSAEEALQLVRNSLDLVIAGDLEAARASDLLVASLKGFGAEAGEAGRLVDLFNEVANRYATNVEELATGFARLSPVAKAMGFTFEETAGILTPVIEVFRSGSEAGNAMRTVLLRLQDDSKPVQEALKAIGVAQFDANGQLRSGRDIYFDVADAFGRLDDSQRTFYAAQLAGLDQSAKFLAALDGVGKTAQIAGKDFDYLGSAAKEVETRLQATEMSVQRAKVSFTDLAISIGTPLLNEFGGVADAIAAIFAAIGNKVRLDGFGGLVQYIERIMGDVEQTLAAVARNLPAALENADLSGFRVGIEAVLGAVRELFAGINLSSVDGLTKAIETVGVAFVGLSRYVAGVIESFKPLFDLLVNVGSGIDGVDSSIFQFAGQLGGIATQINIVSGAFAGMVPWMETLLGLFVAKQGIGLIGAVQNFVPAASAAATALAGPAGLVIAATAAGIKVGELLTILVDWREASNRAEQAQEGLAEATGQVRERLAEISEDLGIPIADMEEFNRLVKEGVVVADEVAGTWRLAGEAADQLADASGRSWEEIDRHNNALLRASETAERAAQSENRLTGETTKGTTAVATRAQVTQQAADAEVRALERAADAKRKFDLEMAKLDAGIAMKLIEQQTTISLARIEADTRRMQMAYESVGLSIQSTGQQLGALYQLIGGGGDMQWFQLQEIQRGIEKEERRRDQALELQKRLVNAEIEMMQARTRALAKGQALISVDGAGLQPHLEAFMWEILKAIQVRVNQDGLDMLVGV